MKGRKLSSEKLIQRAAVLALDMGHKRISKRVMQYDQKFRLLKMVTFNVIL
jgi:hypothetical protein